MANLTENISVEDIRDKAVQYYEDTETRANIQDLLNILYYQVCRLSIWFSFMRYFARAFEGVKERDLIPEPRWRERIHRWIL